MTTAHDLWLRLTDYRLRKQQLLQLDAYLDALIEKNQYLNLTRITDRAQAEVKHIADALTLWPFLPPIDQHTYTLADVGTGGGIPGVILAIARPDLQVTLIDSTRKKLVAVEQICRHIGLQNIRSLHARIEAVDQTFDLVTARAVAEMQTLLNWCEHLLNPTGRLLALKGPRISHELADLTSFTRQKWIIQTYSVPIPELSGHQIVLGQKKHSTACSKGTDCGERRDHNPKR